MASEVLFKGSYVSALRGPVKTKRRPSGSRVPPPVMVVAVNVRVAGSYNSAFDNEVPLLFCWPPASNSLPLARSTAP